MLPSRRFRARLASILADRPARERQAETFLIGHYRQHRSLPRGPLASMIRRRRLNFLIARGEIEHLLYLAGTMHRLSKLRHLIVSASAGYLGRVRAFLTRHR